MMTFTLSSLEDSVLRILRTLGTSGPIFLTVRGLTFYERVLGSWKIHFDPRPNIA